jgi:glycogen debranching enzyme
MSPNEKLPVFLPSYPEAQAPASDRRVEVADLIPYLLPGERVINVEHADITKPSSYPSSLAALDRLTGAKHYGDIGKFGPSVASRATEANQNISELRLFEVLFGRDSLRVAQDLLDYYPNLAPATIIELAKLQGTQNNPMSEEEPGRIVHEARDPATDPIAREITAKQGWQWPYYGAVDSTPMFVSTIAKYCRSQEAHGFLNEKYIGKDGQEHSISEAMKGSINWILNRLDQNPEGLLEFKKSNPQGIENQVWKDSFDSYFHSDGSLANHSQGIASIETQALVYDALIDTLSLPDLYLDAETASRCRQAADNIKQQIMNNFWVEDERGGYFALGTDRDENSRLRPLRIRSSNMGHLLNSRILDGDDPETVRRREIIIKTLFSDEMLAAGGIRTISKKEVRFRPGAYHNGNVWLWDTGYIARGLERQGYYGLAYNLRSRVWKAVDQSKKFPEFVRGGDEPEIRLNDRIVDVWDEALQKSNRIEQPPQEVQAWTVAEVVSSKHKYNPLSPKTRLPITAQDPRRLQLEKEILANLSR